YLAIGWPIVLANAALGIVQSADRLVLSSSVSIYDFAQYSLAASTMMVPVTLIAAVSQVFFHHFLPRYVSTLPLARTLLLGVLFLATIQILQSNVFNLYGKQRNFLVYSI